MNLIRLRLFCFRKSTGIGGASQTVTIFGLGKRGTSQVLQGSALGLLLFNIFRHGLDAEIEGTPIGFADDTQLGGVPNTSEDRARIQDDLHRLENWAKTNKIKSQ